MSDKIKPGPDGTFALGKPTRPDDRGGLNVRVGVSRHMRMIVMDFGIETTWVSVPPDTALEQAAGFRRLVERHWGRLSYDISTLPIRVVVNDHGLIESHFPHGAGTLAANPEVFLAWADALENAAMSVIRGSASA